MTLFLSSLNKFDAATKGKKQFSNPQALSSAFSMLGMLQPQAFGLLNRLVSLVLVSNYYIGTGLSYCSIISQTYIHTCAMHFQTTIFTKCTYELVCQYNYSVLLKLCA